MPATYVISSDTFSRGNQSGWGTASDKEIWSQPVGTGALSIVSNRGQVTTNTGSSIMLLGSYMDADLDIRVRFSLSSAGTDYAGAVLRYQNNSNYLFARVQNNTISIVKVIGGVTTILAPTASVSIANSTNYWLHVSAFDSTYLVNVYADGQQEPTGWMLTCVDASITGIGNYGLYAFVNASADTILFDSFQALIIPQLIVTIGENPVRIDESTLQITYRLDERMRAQFNVLDYTASTFFSFGQKVVMTDPTLGTIFTGFVLAVKQDKSNTAPDPTIEHQMDTVDNRHLLDKRRSQKLYVGLTTNTILADLLGRYATQEGVTSTFSLSWAELQSEWSAASLTGVVTTTNNSTGNTDAVDLELAPGASPFSITTQTTSDWTNNGSSSTAFASNNELVPENWQTIMYTAQCNGPSGGTYYDYFQIWSGSYTIQSSDALAFTLWINAGSPSCLVGMDAQLSDGTWLSAFNSGAIADQQNLLKLAPTTDLKGFADNQWYSRTFDLTAAAGKVIKGWYLVFAGSDQGTYTAYFRDISINNPPGNPGSALWIYQDGQPLNLNQQAHEFGYLNGAVSIVTAYIATATWTSAAVSLSSVGIFQSSLASYTATIPSGTTLLVESSADAGTTWYPVTSDSQLLGFLPGQSLASAQFEYRLTMSVSGNDPTVQAIPSIVAFQIYPSYSATKSDTSSTISGSGFSSGTLTNTAVLTLPGTSRGIGHYIFSGSYALMLNGSWRTWVGSFFNSLSGQTIFGTASPSQIVTSNMLQLTTGTAADAKSEFLFAGNWQNFTASLDVQIPASTNENVGLVYRTTNWNNGAETFAYVMQVQSNLIVLGRGSNSGSSGTFTSITSKAVALTAGSWHTLTVIVSGNSHIAQIDGVQYISTTDTTFSATGGIGVRAFNNSGSTKNYYFNNFGVVAATSGSYQSPSLSLNSVGTIGNTIIGIRTEALPTSCSYTLQTSIDGGSTWQTATAGQAIPNLTPGTSVIGKSLLVKILLATTNASFTPMIDALSVYISSAYSASGTRSTAPLGNDQFVRANQSGWGMSTDRQIYTEQGSATLAISSNTGTVSGTGGAHIQLGSQTSTDESVMITFSVGNTASQAGAEARYTNSSGTITAYRAYAQSGNFILDKRVSGTLTTLQTASFTLAISTNYTIRLVCQGTTIQARIWQTSTSEPTTWQLSQTDSSIASGGIAVSASNASGDTIVFTRVLGTIWPDPALFLSGAGRATSSVASHNSVLASNTRVDMLTSIDGGATYQPVANPGDLIPGIGIMAAYSAIRSRSPLAFYRLNEQSGSIIYDSSNNGNTVTLVQTADLTLGQPGALQGLNETGDTSILFDGVASWIDLPTSLNGNGLSAFSFAGWFNLSTTTLGSFSNLISSGTIAAHTGYQIYWNGTTSLQFIVENGTSGATATYTVSPVAGVWWHIVGTYDGAHIKLYVNGVLQATNTLTGSISASSPVTLGATNAHNSCFPGSIQDVAFFASTLQQADVTALYNAGILPTTGTYDDEFAVNSSSNYTQTFGSGGANATWTWDTTNSRLIASGGTKAQLLYNNVLAGEVDMLADYFQSENGGLVWCWQDSGDYYELVIKDSGASSNPNSLTLNKVSGGTSTQLATTTIVFPSQTYKRFHVTMMAGVITVYLDGTQELTYTDGSPFGAGLMGVRNDTSTSYLYDLQLTQLPPDLSSKALYSKLVLSTTDPAATPQVLSFCAAAFGPQIDAGITLPAADYRDTLVSGNIDDLARQSNHSWYVDTNASVWFKETQGIPSPWIAQSGNGFSSIYGGDIEVDSNLEVDVSGDLYRNRQTLTHVSLTNDYTESFVGDGFRRTFTLSYKVSPGDVPTIIVDGVRQTIGVKGATGFQWYYKEGDQTIQQDKSQRILKSFDSLTVSYTGYSTTSVTVDNVAAQTALAAQEGGTGIIEQVTDSHNMPYAAALVLAQQLLDFYSLSGRTIIFKTYRDGLMVGQILTVYLPEENLHGIRMYIIEVDLSMQTLPGNQRLYGYLVTATELPNTKSWQKLLASGLVDPTTGS